MGARVANWHFLIMNDRNNLQFFQITTYVTGNNYIR